MQKNGDFLRISRIFRAPSFKKQFTDLMITYSKKNNPPAHREEASWVESTNHVVKLELFCIWIAVPAKPRCLVSCKKSRALCHCSPVYNLVGLAGFAMNVPLKMGGFYCCILPLRKGMQMVVYSILFF